VRRDEKEREKLSSLCVPKRFGSCILFDALIEKDTRQFEHFHLNHFASNYGSEQKHKRREISTRRYMCTMCVRQKKGQRQKDDGRHVVGEKREKRQISKKILECYSKNEWKQTDHVLERRLETVREKERELRRDDGSE